MLWGVANICSVLAIAEVGYAVAYCLLQSACLLGAAIGILVWRELARPGVYMVMGAAPLVVGGACLIAVYN